MEKEVAYAMFNAYEFLFADRSCADFGLMLYDIGGKGQSDVSFGNKAEIVETRTTGRIQPLHFGVNYHSEPLQFSLIFGCDHELDRFTMEEIAFWLTGYQDYQWLCIEQPDLEHVQFRCLITKLTPITVGWLPVAFEAEVTCDCPYAYGMPFEQTHTISGTTEIVLRDSGSVREYYRPDIHFVPGDGTTALSITNVSDGERIFKIENIPTGSDIVIDGRNGIIRELNHGYNLYGGFNMNFFRTVHGDNRLLVEGDGVLTFSGRFLHNVAG